MSLYRPKFINEWRDIKREGGYKLLMKKKGFQVIAAFFIFYLCRLNIFSFCKLNIFWYIN